MADQRSQYLKDARRALKKGDHERATELFTQILEEDFTYRPAWELLHKQYGPRLPFRDFQRAFAKKYFPEKGVLLEKPAERPKKGLVEGDFASQKKPSLIQRILAFFTNNDSQKQAAEETLERIGAAPLEPAGAQLTSPAGSVQAASEQQALADPTSAAADSQIQTYPDDLHKISPFLSEPAEIPGGKKIRVVVVDDIDETRENIIRSLTFNTQIEVVGSARTGKQGIAIVKRVHPDVVLMDVNMPDMDGITATGHIRSNNTSTEIIILTVQDDLDYMRNAMQAGARDFLVKPPMIDELLSAVLRAGVIAHEQKSKEPALPAVQVASPPPGGGKVITIYSPRGGAGCTTLCANLAVLLHNEESPVVIVDGDLQYGDIPVLFNLQSKNSVIDLTTRADELDPEIVEEVLVPHKSGIKILAGTRPEVAESVTAESFGKLLRYLRKLYAYVIVDTTTHLSDATLAAMENSNAILLLLTQDIPSIANAHKFMDLAPLLKLNVDKIQVVMNRYDKRIGISPEKVGKSFKKKIQAVIPLEERTVLPSVNRGVPFMEQSDVRVQPLGEAMLELARVVREEVY